MARSWCLCWIAIAACARGALGPVDGQSDDAPCTEQTYFADIDSDGHGDPTKPMQACEQPAGMVTSSDDCDDGHPQRYPGSPEVCDLIDNDCNNSTPDPMCPIGCTPVRRPAPDNIVHSYLFCNTTASWVTASATCAGAMYKLAEIDDGIENDFVRTTANSMLASGNYYIGGSDSAQQDKWVWEGGSQFWQGGSGGFAIGGHYANWTVGKPDDSNGTENCAELTTGGGWNDVTCGTAFKFICRR